MYVRQDAQDDGATHPLPRRGQSARSGKLARGTVWSHVFIRARPEGKLIGSVLPPQSLKNGAGAGSFRAPAGHISAERCKPADPAGGIERTDAYISRLTVIGIAPLLNSIHAISIGSTMPTGTSMRIGDPMLIWSARAPIIRAFSNRV